MADRDRPMRARDDAEGFLSRWSRRKAEARSAPAASPATDDATDDAGPGAQAAPEATHEALRQDAPAPIDPKDLPDIASLDASSDFSVFMRPGVPAHLRTLALRKLWRSDPIFSKLDGLVEYGEDYTIPSWPKGAIKTAYRIGRGFMNELETLETAKVDPGLPEPTVGEPAPEPESTVASTIREPPADSPAEPWQPIPALPASSEAQPVPDPTSGPVKASGPTRRPLPRRG
jgi:Protein of unknown function (DUF3306)